MYILKFKGLFRIDYEKEFKTKEEAHRYIINIGYEQKQYEITER